MAISLTKGQQTFVKRLAGKTGLNSRVIAAWVLAEEGGANSSAAQSRQAAKNHNWLNIGYFDSGAGSITKDKVFSDPVRAADATAEFLEGKKFGASPGIRRILSTVGKDQNAQINAIAKSGWASSGYNNGNNLRQLLGEAPAPGKSVGGDASASVGAQASTRSVRSQTLTPGALPTGADPAALIAALAKPQPVAPVLGGTPLAAPAQLAGPTFSKTHMQVQATGGPQRQQSGVDMLLAAAAQTPQGELPVAPTVTTSTTAGSTGSASAGNAGAVTPSSPQAGGGKVVIAGGAETTLPGRQHSLQKPILGLLHKISSIAGHPITVTTGTNHDRLTTTGNVSDHFEGNAADLGMGGDARESAAVSKKGDNVAAHAIQAVTGMKFGKALALARQGGIHNFDTKAGRVQIIWKTLEGGNHYNHVHVGLNPNR